MHALKVCVLKLLHSKSSLTLAIRTVEQGLHIPNGLLHAGQQLDSANLEGFFHFTVRLSGIIACTSSDNDLRGGYTLYEWTYRANLPHWLWPALTNPGSFTTTRANNYTKSK